MHYKKKYQEFWTKFSYNWLFYYTIMPRSIARTDGIPYYIPLILLTNQFLHRKLIIYFNPNETDHQLCESDQQELKYQAQSLFLV